MGNRTLLTWDTVIFWPCPRSENWWVIAHLDRGRVTAKRRMPVYEKRLAIREVLGRATREHRSMFAAHPKGNREAKLYSTMPEAYGCVDEYYNLAARSDYGIEPRPSWAKS